MLYHSYAQWWSMPPLLGLLTLCRIAINWNTSSDVLLGLHATGTREQPVWQQWWMIWSGSHWRPGVITNGWPCFIVCNITWCLLLQLITLSGSAVVHDEMYEVPYARTNVYKYSFFPASVRMWSTLPLSLIHHYSFQSFKTGVCVYNRHWLTWP